MLIGNVCEFCIISSKWSKPVSKAWSPTSPLLKAGVLLSSYFSSLGSSLPYYQVTKIPGFIFFFFSSNLFFCLQIKFHLQAWKLPHHLMLSWGKSLFAGDVQLFSTGAENASFSFHQHKPHILLISMVLLRDNISLNAFSNFVCLTQGEQSHVQASAGCQCSPLAGNGELIFSHCTGRGRLSVCPIPLPLVMLSSISGKKNWSAPRKLFSPT